MKKFHIEYLDQLRDDFERAGTSALGDEEVITMTTQLRNQIVKALKEIVKDESNRRYKKVAQ